mgnify:CR=1 FL=1|jgi:dihydroorotate dehydrogenase electron transfer subunit
MADPLLPRHVDAELVATKRSGAYRVLTLSARGVPEGFRPGNFVALSVGERTTTRAFWVRGVRQTSALGPTLEIVVERRGWGTDWLLSQPVGAKIALTGPLGRPFALPREPVSCVLVGEGVSTSALFALGERLRERGSLVSLVVAAPDEPHLLSPSDARRWARSVTVVTGDGSVGLRGTVPEHLPAVLRSAEADVIYGAGPVGTVRGVAAAAEAHGAWSQVTLELPVPCGTGLCHGCPLPVVGEDGISRVVRACAEGPVVRGDRVLWEALP